MSEILMEAVERIAHESASDDWQQTVRSGDQWGQNWEKM